MKHNAVAASSGPPFIRRGIRLSGFCSEQKHLCLKALDGTQKPGPDVPPIKTRPTFTHMGSIARHRNRLVEAALLIRCFSRVPVCFHFDGKRTFPWPTVHQRVHLQLQGLPSRRGQYHPVEESCVRVAPGVPAAHRRIFSCGSCVCNSPGHYQI